MHFLFHYWLKQQNAQATLYPVKKMQDRFEIHTICFHLSLSTAVCAKMTKYDSNFKYNTVTGNKKLGPLECSKL